MLRLHDWPNVLATFKKQLASSKATRSNPHAGQSASTLNVLKLICSSSVESGLKAITVNLCTAAMHMRYITSHKFATAELPELTGSLLDSIAKDDSG